MSVENCKTIDFVSLQSVPGYALLVVSDHLEWRDDMEHQLLLQEKLNGYLAFVESGELMAKFPDAGGKKIQIRVVFKYRPDESGTQFLDNVRNAIEATGIQFAYQVGLEENPTGTTQ